MKRSNSVPFISLYVLPTGRRAVLCRRVAAVAEALGLDDLAARARAGEAHDLATRRLEIAWRSPGSRHAPEARQLDAQLDRAVNAFHGLLVARAELKAADVPQGAAVRTLLEEVFPHGVAYYTRLPYVEQHGSLNAVLPRLDAGGDLRRAVEILGLEWVVSDLVALNARYGAALEVHPERPSFAEVERAREEGLRQLHALVAVIVGSFPDDGPQDVEARERLLQPVVDQQEAVRARLRERRGAVTDVDPETGEELLDEDDVADDEVVAPVPAEDGERRPVVGPDVVGPLSEAAADEAADEDVA